MAYPEGFPQGAAPLLRVLHGNQSANGCGGVFSRCDQHEGFFYLIEHLASQGFIAVSVNAERVNAPDFDRVPERAALLLEHLRRWRAWSARGDGPLGEALVDHVDWRRVGLAGHSRGGEAVIAAHNANLESAQPCESGAVLSLAPTDKQALTILDVPHYAVVPACDGDVLDARGVRFFDRALRHDEANPTPKQAIYPLGANHNYFNALWGRDGGGCFGITPISREAQEALAKRLAAAFFRRYLNGEAALHHAFTGDAAGPATPEVPAWLSYADPQRLALDDFAQAPGANALGGAVTFEGLEAAPCGPEHAAACSVAFAHEADALALAWAAPGAAYESAVPAPHADVSAYTHLSFRVTQNPEEARLAGLDPAGQPAHFSVRLRDRQGREAAVSTEAYGGAPFPIGATVEDPETGTPLRLAVLRTLRLPLAAFEGVDPTQLAEVALVFDRDPRGSVYLAHLHFTR